MTENIIKKAGDIISKNTRENGYCVLALIDDEGYPASSTISASKTNGIKEVAFCTGLNSPKAKRIKNSNKASVCFNAPDYSITLLGTIEILTDPQIKKEMWYDGLKHHFTGPEDPNYCVLKLTTKQYSLFIDWQEIKGKL